MRKGTKMAERVGRPKKHGEHRTIPLNVLLTASEKMAVEACALASGCAMADVVRSALQEMGIIPKPLTPAEAALINATAAKHGIGDSAVAK